MKVFLISANYPPARCGMADYADRLRACLIKRGKVVPHVITSRPGAAAPEALPRVHRIMSDWGAADNRRLLKLIEKESPEAAHLQYHCDDFPDKNEAAEIPFLIKERFPRVKTVVSLAGFGLQTPEGLRNVARLTTHSDALTVTTDPDMDIVLEKFPASGKKLFRIYDRANIIFNGKLKTDTGEIRRRYNVTEADFLLINFGFINQDKGFEQILRALRLVLDRGFSAKFLAAGELHDGRRSAPGRYYLKLKSLVKDLRLNNSVIWTGYLCEDAVSRHILSADAAVMPFRDGISGKRSSFWSVLEHGIPAITTFPEKAGLPESLENGKNAVLVSAGDHKALAEQIIKLITDGKFRRKIGRNGVKLIKKRYSWEMLAKELEAVYSK